VRARILLALAAAYAALAGLVAAGTLTGLDQAAVDVMPELDPDHLPTRGLEDVVPFHGSDTDSALGLATDVVTITGSPLVSAALVGALLLVVRRRHGLRPALVGGFAFVAVNLVELLCKDVLTRPGLTQHGAHVLAFDSSWPSGHALRAAFAAVLAARLFPRLAPVAAAWTLAAATLLVVGGWHTPSDVVGGVLLGVLGALFQPAGTGDRARLAGGKTTTDRDEIRNSLVWRDSAG
jgi:hypothetical protein